MAFDPAPIEASLDQAAAAFDAVRGDVTPERAAQFDGHLATVRMAVDNASKEGI